MGKYKVLDLFSGAGGFSLGFSIVENNAFEIVKAIDINENACKTLKQNFKNKSVLNADLTESQIIEALIKEFKNKIDVIIGGPPCQTFSLIGPSRSGSKDVRNALKDDPRNILFKYYLKLVKEIRPKFVVFENVVGITSKNITNYTHSNSKEKKVIDLICQELKSFGYTLDFENGNKTGYEILNAADYGVPQVRKRVFVIANKLDLDNSIPNRTHGKDKDLKSYVTLKDAIGDLPPLLPKISTRGIHRLNKIDIIKENILEILDQLLIYFEEDNFKNIMQNNISVNNMIKRDIINYRSKIDVNNLNDNEFLLFNKIINKSFKKLNKSSKDNHIIDNKTFNNEFLSYVKGGTLESHFTRSHNIRDILIFLLMKKGTDSSHFFKGNNYYYDEEDKLKLLKELYPYDKTKHIDTYVKHHEDFPSKTILAHLSKDGLRFIHPQQIRSFTPLEAARLQSFPDKYKFYGSMISQFRQIGNAVPPLLAKAIGKSIYEKLENI